jgi:hypothetical protein
MLMTPDFMENGRRVCAPYFPAPEAADGSGLRGLRNRSMECPCGLLLTLVPTPAQAAVPPGSPAVSAIAAVSTLQLLWQGEERYVTHVRLAATPKPGMSLMTFRCVTPGNEESARLFLEGINHVHMLADMAAAVADESVPAGPVAVHCTAGVGRSALVVAADMALETARSRIVVLARIHLPLPPSLSTFLSPSHLLTLALAV